MRELIPGQANNRTTLFNGQFNKNASTDGAYVVYFGKILSFFLLTNKKFVSVIHEFHETYHSVTFTILVNSHQR